MKYQTHIWADPEGMPHLLVRTEHEFGKILQGARFQKLLQEEFEIDNVIPIVVDPDGVHTYLGAVMPLVLTDEGLNELPWKERVWGDNNNEE